MVEIIRVTKKGQATIPKKLRTKYGIRDKVIFEENEKGIIIKALPSPDDDYGSLRGAFGGKTAREILEEGRQEEYAQEQERLKRVRAANV
jgi:AbrB family looped-hinge helix DNA binding protein